jgi:hypothetical protein
MQKSCFERLANEAIGVFPKIISPILKMLYITTLQAQTNSTTMTRLLI